MTMCADVEAAGIPLDRPNMHNVLMGVAKGRFPQEKSAVCSALQGSLLYRANAVGLPLVAMSCGAPQGRTGFNGNSLAIKVMDQTRSMTLDGSARFPIAVDVLRDGRRIIEIYGLRLDSHNEGNCDYSPRGSLLRDLGTMLMAVPEYDALVRFLIGNFPGDGARMKMVKQLALDELAQAASD